MVETKEVELKLGDGAQSDTTKASETGSSSKPQKKVTVKFDEEKKETSSSDSDDRDIPEGGINITAVVAAASLPKAFSAETKPHSILKQKSSGNFGKISLGFDSLNTDFMLPKDFTLIKKLGKGAYGKVMQIMH